MTETAVTGWKRVTGGMRSLARELAAAVYVIIGSALVGRFFLEREWAQLAIDPVLTVVAGFVLGIVIRGPWWTTYLVGVFVSLLQVGISLGFSQGLASISFGGLAIGSAIVSLSGAIGAHVARIIQRRREPS